MRSHGAATDTQPISFDGKWENRGSMRLVESSNGHLYADPLAFERLMLLIATLARYPGVGALESKATCKRSSGLQVVKARMQTLACRCGLNLPNCSVHTLRKDLECLKRFQILDRRRYCQGYFLGIGALGQSELQLALDGLATMAAVQQDNKAQQTYQHLSQRLKGAEGEAALFYPVRSHHDRSVVCTDPIDRHTRSRNPDTLSQQLALVESAILQGQAVELRRIETVAASQSNPNRSNQGAVAVWPLQLLYYSGVWHLLYERFDKRYLAIERIDCLRDACKVLSDQPRGLKAQQPLTSCWSAAGVSIWENPENNETNGRENSPSFLSRCVSLGQSPLRFCEKTVAIPARRLKKAPGTTIALPMLTTAFSYHRDRYQSAASGSIAMGHKPRYCHHRSWWSSTVGKHWV